MADGKSYVRTQQVVPEVVLPAVHWQVLFLRYARVVVVCCTTAVVCGRPGTSELHPQVSLVGMDLRV